MYEYMFLFIFLLIFIKRFIFKNTVTLCKSLYSYGLLIISVSFIMEHGRIAEERVILKKCATTDVIEDNFPLFNFILRIKLYYIQFKLYKDTIE